jgi:hypothetical protein
MTSSPKIFIRLRTRKPTRGSIILTVHQLCLLWGLYRTRHLDARIWFTAHEMVARRCQLAPHQIPVYTRRELLTLVGGVGGSGGAQRSAASSMTTPRLRPPEGRQRRRRGPPPSLAASAG